MVRAAAFGGRWALAQPRPLTEDLYGGGRLHGGNGPRRRPERCRIWTDECYLGEGSVRTEVRGSQRACQALRAGEGEWREVRLVAPSALTRRTGGNSGSPWLTQ